MEMGSGQFIWGPMSERSEPFRDADPPGWHPVLEALPQGVLLTDGQGRFVMGNAAALDLLGLDLPGLMGLDLHGHCCHLLAEDRSLLPPESFAGLRAFRDQVPVPPERIGLGWEDGRVLWVSVSATPVVGGGVLISLEDRTATHLSRTILAARARIGDMADGATLEEVLRGTLDEAEKLTGSCIGFFHFVDADQQMLTLQAWSTRTAKEFCRAEGHGMHYPVRQAGVWADALRSGQPAVHNDYPSLPHRKGLPEGHAVVLRELVVPVLRGGRIVALLGVGNKAFPYGPKDVETVQGLADLAWEVAEKKRTEEALRASRALLGSVLDSLQAHVAVLDAKGEIIAVNEPWLRFARENGIREPQGIVVGVNYLEKLAPAEAAGDAGVTAIRQGLLAVLEGRSRAHEAEYPCHGPAGERWFHMTAVPLSGASGGIVVAHENITQRKTAELALALSEARLRSMLRTAMDAVWLVGTDGSILEVNEAACQMLGHSREELIGKSVPEVEAEERPEDTAKRIRRVMERGFDIFQSTHRRKDGSTFPVEVSTTFLRDTGQLVAYVRDITGRVAAEAALRESEGRFRALVEQAGDGFELVDAQGRLVDVNQATCQALGYTREELLAMNLWGIDPLVSPEAFVDAFRLLPEGPLTLESQHQRKDGSIFPVEIRLSSITLQGEPYAFVIARDISERKRLEAERRDLETQFQRAQKMDSLGSLAGGVAHDMNNVLAAIMALSSIHENQAPPGSPLRRSMETVSKACQRGRSLVQGLLGFARQGLAEEKALNLNDLIREQKDLLEHSTFHQVILDLDLATDLSLVKGDATALSHALMNLCVNAVEAMPGGGTLSLRTRNRAPGSVILEVQDTGMGMPPEVLAKATDPFFTTKPQGKGTGLGLAIVYGTAKSHRGHFELHSEAGKGTRATLQLPAVAPEAPLAPEAEARVPGLRSLRVLVVDDDEMLRETLASLLEVLGHAQVTLGSGEEALQLLEEGQPIDLVILDLNMPGLGGAATLPLLRALRPNLPVILATGRADQQALDLVDGIARVSILAKPFSLQELKTHLAALFSNAH